MIDIHLDASGKTYEYILTFNDKEVMRGDGWESVDEIQTFLGEIQDAMEEEPSKNLEIKL